MFLCAITGKTSKPGDKCNKVCVKRRPRVYTQEFFNDDLNDWEVIEVAKGWEVVREVNATDEGVELWNSLSDEEKASLQLL